MSKRYNLTTAYGWEDLFRDTAKAFRPYEPNEAQVDVESLKVPVKDYSPEDDPIDVGYNRAIDYITTHYTLTKKED